MSAISGGTVVLLQIPLAWRWGPFLGLPCGPSLHHGPYSRKGSGGCYVNPSRLVPGTCEITIRWSL